MSSFARFTSDLDIPDLDAGTVPDTPDPGYIQVFGRGKRLASQGSDGTIRRLGTTPETATDPAQPEAGDTWVKRTLLNTSGTLQGLVGGFPQVLTRDQNQYHHCFATDAGDVVRSLLT